MFEIIYSFLVSIIALIGFVTVILLSRSSLRFTKGEIQKITSDFVWGTIFMFGGMVAQTMVDLLDLTKTPIDMAKYLFMLIGFSYYFLASYRIHKMSNVLGFASKDMPKKLKRILKS